MGVAYFSLISVVYLFQNFIDIIYHWIWKKWLDENFYISFENGLMNVLDNKKNKDVYLKIGLK